MYANTGQSYAYDNTVFNSFFVPPPQQPQANMVFAITPTNYWNGQNAYINNASNQFPGPVF
jgi:hypothetical protein